MRLRLARPSARPADLGNIGDLLIVQFDLEAEVGEPVLIEVLAGSVVLASRDVTLEPAPGVPPGLAAMRRVSRQDFTAPTAVMTVTEDQLAPAVTGEQLISLAVNGVPGLTV